MGHFSNMYPFVIYFLTRENYGKLAEVVALKDNRALLNMSLKKWFLFS